MRSTAVTSGSSSASLVDRRTDPAVFTKIAAEVRQWLATDVYVELLDDPGISPPERSFSMGNLRVLVRLRKRANEFWSDEFPLIANPLPWTRYYDLYDENV